MLLNTNGKWMWFNSSHEMQEYYNKNKWGIHYPQYPDPFIVGWYYVYTEEHCYRRNTCNYCLVFTPAKERLKECQNAIRELVEEANVARNKKWENQ